MLLCCFKRFWTEANVIDQQDLLSFLCSDTTDISEICSGQPSPPSPPPHPQFSLLKKVQSLGVFLYFVKSSLLLLVSPVLHQLFVCQVRNYILAVLTLVPEGRRKLKKLNKVCLKTWTEGAKATGES